MSQNLIYKHLSPSLTKYYLKFSIYIKNLIINIYKNLYAPFQKNPVTNTASILVVDSVNNVFDTSVVAKKLCTKHKHFYCAIQTGKKILLKFKVAPHACTCMQKDYFVWRRSSIEILILFSIICFCCHFCTLLVTNCTYEKLTRCFTTDKWY